MAQFMSVFQVNSAPDIGSVGISRFHVVQSDGTEMPAGPASVVGAALAVMYGALKAFFPTTMNYQVQPTYTVLDVPSGQVQASLGYTPVPALVTGTGVSGAAGGTGARGYWHTSTVLNRRIIRGATYFTPMTGAYSTTNGLSSAVQTAVTNAMVAYINALTAQALLPVVYHRPAKGATVGGVAGIIGGASCSAQPGSLRSRRM
jgi:hypothetical protein